MKLDIKERYSLKHLGDGWQHCYIEFSPITMKDLTGDILTLSGLEQDNPETVAEATKSTVSLLKEHFVGGKVLSGGKVVELKRDDLEELPVRVLTGVLSFLSQGLAEENQKPSGTSSQAT